MLHTLSDASLSPSLFNMLQHLLYIATKALKISLWLASKVFAGLTRAAKWAFGQIYVLVSMISLLLLP